MLHEWYAHLMLWVVGAIIGLGQLLSDSKSYTLKNYIGHALVSGGLASAAGSVLLLIPNAPLMAVIGLASAISTVGTVAMRDIAIRYLNRKKDE